MKKTITIATALALFFLFSFSCKKSSTTASTPEPSPATPATPAPLTVSTTFSVNGSSEGTDLMVVKGTTSNKTTYEFLALGSPWTVEFIFPGANSPASGTYSIEDSLDITVPAGQCTIFLAGPDNKYGRPSSGTVKVTTGATNTIEFSNILAPQKDLSLNIAATYTISGIIKY
jgi:hypothetical protein